MKPIILVLGPSGVGKSYLSKLLEKSMFQRTCIDTDKVSRTFAANGFPREWDNDFRKVDFALLEGILQDRLNSEHAGAIVSFPTVYVYTAEKLVGAMELGVTPVVLWGKKEDCIQAAKKRIEEKGGTFDFPRYQRKNSLTFQLYGRSDYDDFRVRAFREDGSRYTDEELLAEVNKRTAG